MVRVDNRILGTYRQLVKGIVPESNARQPASANVHSVVAIKLVQIEVAGYVYVHIVDGKLAARVDACCWLGRSRRSTTLSTVDGIVPNPASVKPVEVASWRESDACTMDPKLVFSQATSCPQLSR